MKNQKHDSKKTNLILTNNNLSNNVNDMLEGDDSRIHIQQPSEPENSFFKEENRNSGMF